MKKILSVFLMVGPFSISMVHATISKQRFVCGESQVRFVRGEIDTRAEGNVFLRLKNVNITYNYSNASALSCMGDSFATTECIGYWAPSEEKEVARLKFSQEPDGVHAKYVTMGAYGHTEIDSRCTIRN